MLALHWSIDKQWLDVFWIKYLRLLDQNLLCLIEKCARKIDVTIYEKVYEFSLQRSIDLKFSSACLSAL